MKRVLPVILLLLAVPAAWLFAEWRLQAGVRDWIADRTAEGWIVRSAPSGWSGFPFQAGLVLHDVTLSSTPRTPSARAPIPAGLDWTVQRLELRLSPLSPRTLLLLPDGPQQLRLGLLPPLEVAGQGARIMVPLRESADLVIAANVETLHVGAPGTSLATGALSLAVTLHSGPRQGEAAFRLAAADITASGLPGSLSSLAVAGAIEGGAAGDQASPAASAAAWRDHGGHLVLQSIAARWGRLSASGNATASLDGALQPRAAGTLRLTGYDEGLDVLATSGTIGHGTARVARTVLGLMAQHNDDGTTSVELPMGWHDGVVSAGQIPLLRTPPIDWAFTPG